MKSKKFKFITSCIMIITLLFTMTSTAFAETDKESTVEDLPIIKPVVVGHAVASENGTKEGEMGDSTGKEVVLSQWYDKGWDICLRPTSIVLAEKSAKACEAGCANDYIGYGQSDRNTAYESYKEVGEMSKIRYSNTDEAAFMTLCAIAGGCTELEKYCKKDAPTTSTMKKIFMATKKYEVLTNKQYMLSDKYLQRGDILVKEGEDAVMVLTNGYAAKEVTAFMGSNPLEKVNSALAEDANKIKKVVKVYLLYKTVKFATKCVVSAAKFNYQMKRIAAAKKHNIL